jgi:hypothetical protein
MGEAGGTHLFQCSTRAVLEVGVHSLESEPSAGEVAGVEPFTDQDTGGEVGERTPLAQ